MEVEARIHRFANTSTAIGVAPSLPVRREAQVQIERRAGFQRHRVTPSHLAEMYGDVVRACRQRHIDKRPGVIDSVHSESVQIVDLQTERRPLVVPRDTRVGPAQPLEREFEVSAAGGAIEFGVDQEARCRQRCGMCRGVRVDGKISWKCDNST
jgi:hypothetical protein